MTASATAASSCTTDEAAARVVSTFNAQAHVALGQVAVALHLGLLRAVDLHVLLRRQRLFRVACAICATASWMPRLMRR